MATFRLLLLLYNTEFNVKRRVITANRRQLAIISARQPQRLALWWFVVYRTVSSVKHRTINCFSPTCCVAKTST